MTSHRFNTPPFHFCGNYGQVGHTQTYRHTHTSVTMWSNSRLPAKALHTFVLVQEVRDVEARDGLTVSQRTYSEEEVIYNRQQSVSKSTKTGSSGRNSSMQPHHHVKMDMSKVEISMSCQLQLVTISCVL